ncbi:hypothetical protein JRT4AKPX_JRT4AKP_02284 [Klebsiella pneumoniae]|nr:hypothetical protein JRT4AKPX_JRT4AKP_02284 [Klebsiella pneumoniae]
MRNFILRRLLQTLPMLLLASFIIFLLFAKTPGDFIDGNITLTAARAAELKAIYGPRPAAIDPLPPLAGTVAAR